jgi:putative Mg2+ transporter-C (MgtC) family protein
MPPTLSEIGIRLLVAFGAGFLVGWEREAHGRPAGLRTNILACVASATAMCLSELLMHETSPGSIAAGIRADPARLGAGILTGIGFLGAGTIIRHEQFIRGVTTAATLWLVTILGLAFGSGHFALGTMGLGLALPTLYVLPMLERHIAGNWYGTLTITGELDALREPELQKLLQEHGASVRNVHLAKDVEHRVTTLSFELKCTRPERLELPRQLVDAVAEHSGVRHVKWE